MNILMVDNGSAHAGELELILRGYGHVRRLKFRRHSRLEHEWADVIVLSGSHVKGGFMNRYGKETKMVRTTDVPIIGICYGFELIAVAFGDTISRKKEKYEGLFTVELRPELIGSEYTKTYSVYEAHHWVLEKTTLEVLGTSERGIEALRHPTRMIFGMQFHPEVTVPENDGRIILDRLIRYVSKSLPTQR